MQEPCKELTTSEVLREACLRKEIFAESLQHFLQENCLQRILVLHSKFQDLRGKSLQGFLQDLGRNFVARTLQRTLQHLRFCVTDPRSLPRKEIFAKSLQLFLQENSLQKILVLHGKFQGLREKSLQGFLQDLARNFVARTLQRTSQHLNCVTDPRSLPRKEIFARSLQLFLQENSLQRILVLYAEFQGLREKSLQGFLQDSCKECCCKNLAKNLTTSEVLRHRAQKPASKGNLCKILATFLARKCPCKEFSFYTVNSRVCGKKSLQGFLQVLARNFVARTLQRTSQHLRF